MRVAFGKATIILVAFLLSDRRKEADYVGPETLASLRVPSERPAVTVRSSVTSRANLMRNQATKRGIRNCVAL